MVAEAKVGGQGNIMGRIGKSAFPDVEYRLTRK